MKKVNNFFSDEFQEYKPKKLKIPKSKQLSMAEIDREDGDYFSKKRKKNEYYKRY